MPLDFRNVIHQVIKHQGLDVGVEYRPGDIRHKGTGFERKMRSGYGHLRGIKGDDGEAADAYIHPDLFKEPPEGSHKIFTVKQLKKDGSYDEEKHMLGWHNEHEAKQAYLDEMPESFFGGIAETTPIALQGYAESGVDTIQKKYDSLPAAQQEKFRRQVVYKIVNENYGDRISNFNIDESPKIDCIASGNFITPRLGGKNLVVDYQIKDDGVVLTPRNLDVIDHAEEQYGAAIALAFSLSESWGYAPLDLYNFAATKKCDRGWACGGTCLSKTKKNCKRSLEGEHKTYVDWLQHQANTGAKLHDTHQEEVDKLGLEKPKVKSKTETKTKPKIETEPTVEAKVEIKKKLGTHEDLPENESPENTVKAMSKISGLSEKDCTESYHAIRKFAESYYYPAIREEESSGESGKYEDTINAINNYLYHAPPFKGTIYRGLQFDDKKQRDDFVRRIEKSGFKNNAMSSFSSNQKVAESFTGKSDDDSVVIVVKNNKNGVSIRNISENTKEDEVLCPMKGRYKFISKTKKDGIYYVEVEQ